MFDPVIAYCEAHPDGKKTSDAFGNSGAGYDGVDLAFCVLENDAFVPSIPVVPPMIPVGCERDWLAHQTYLTASGTVVTQLGSGCEIYPQYVGHNCGSGTKRFVAHQLKEQRTYKGSATKLRTVRELWGDNHDTGTRPGDSGGPLFVRLPDKTWRVIGVHHGGSLNNDYAEAIPPYLHWIEQASGIDITPCHQFGNGGWYAVSCAPAFPKSDHSGYFGHWSHHCVGAPWGSSDGYVQQSLVGSGGWCSAWPKAPTDEAAPTKPTEGGTPELALTTWAAPPERPASFKAPQSHPDPAPHPFLESSRRVSQVDPDRAESQGVAAESFCGNPPCEPAPGIGSCLCPGTDFSSPRCCKIKTAATAEPDGAR